MYTEHRHKLSLFVMSHFALTSPVSPKISRVIEMTKAPFVTVQSILSQTKFLKPSGFF
jgi:hypothetical protein